MSSDSQNRRGKSAPEIKADHDDYYRRGRRHDFRSRELWSQEHDQKIIAPNRPEDMELAKQIGRSVKAIQNRRYLLKNGKTAVGGLNGKLGRSARRLSVSGPPKPHIQAPKSPGLESIRLRARDMGLKPPADASVEVIQEWIRRYQPAHDAGVRVGAEIELTSYGRCKVVAILPGTRKVTVSIYKTGKQRFVPLNDLKEAFDLARTDARRGGR